MINGLKDHPIAIEASFDFSLVITFAFPQEQLKSLLPECLELDTFNNEWGFLAVAVVDTKKLRVKGFPVFLGADFVLIGYRIFVRYNNNNGKRLRGLYILKSETDKKLMEVVGNAFTHYKYQQTDIFITQSGTDLTISSRRSGLLIKIKDDVKEAGLPNHSPFSDWKEARRYAGPLPFTFSYNEARNEVLIVEGVRESWIPRPVEVERLHIPFIEQSGLKDGRVANAFVIKDIPYYWKKGRKEIWQA